MCTFADQDADSIDFLIANVAKWQKPSPASRVMLLRVATVREKVRENEIFSRSGKSQGKTQKVIKMSGKIDILEWSGKSQGKMKKPEKVREKSGKMRKMCPK